MSSKYLSFQVGEGHYAVALEEVSQIVRYESSMGVPSAPPFVDGVINLGAEVVPVVNLAARLEARARPASGASRVIVAGRQGRRYGLLVDGVREIVELEESSVSQEVAGVLGLKPRFVRGIAKVRDRLLVLLDVVALLEASPAESFREPTG